MAICENCGIDFDLDDAEDWFEIETHLLSYQNLRKRLCGNCAVSAIENEEEGIYFETCEKCGKTFDLFEDSRTFSNNFSWESGLSLRDCWQSLILCCDCALDYVETEL